MAPKRKPRGAANNSAASAGTLVTRRSPRLANAAVAPPVADPKPPRKKKAKTVAFKKEDVIETESPPSPAKQEPVPQCETVDSKKEVVTETESPPSPSEQEPVPERETFDSSKTIIIEHCKQCNSFKTRAIQVKLGLEKGVEGVKVVVNPEKPRRGCFEIREGGGGIFVSLLDMKRPFKQMKGLDMEKVIYDIVEKIR